MISKVEDFVTVGNTSSHTKCNHRLFPDRIWPFPATFFGFERLRNYISEKQKYADVSANENAHAIHLHMYHEYV